MSGRQGITFEKREYAVRRSLRVPLESVRWEVRDSNDNDRILRTLASSLLDPHRGRSVLAEPQSSCGQRCVELLPNLLRGDIERGQDCLCRFIFLLEEGHE
jgi:hypothetical protein